MRAYSVIVGAYLYVQLAYNYVLSNFAEFQLLMNLCQEEIDNSFHRAVRAWLLFGGSGIHLKSWNSFTKSWFWNVIYLIWTSRKQSLRLKSFIFQSYMCEVIWRWLYSVRTCIFGSYFFIFLALCLANWLCICPNRIAVK